MINPMIGMPQGAEWLIILAIVILVFGAAKLPDLARGTGQALRIFKAETKGLKDDDEADEDSPAVSPPAIPTAAEDLPTTANTETDRQTDTRNG